MAVIQKTIALTSVADVVAVEKLTKTLKELYRTAGASEDEIKKGATELRGVFKSLEAELKQTETQLRANGVSGKALSQSMLAAKGAYVDAKNGMEQFTAASKSGATTLGELKSVQRAARDELGHLRAELDKTAAASGNVDGKQQSMLGTLTKLAGGAAIAYKAWQLLKDSVAAGLEFDKSASIVGMSIASQAGGFDAARQQVQDAAGQGSAGTMFDKSKVLESLEKLRDSPDVLNEITQNMDRFTPIVQAATATMQDLAVVTDTMDAAMDHFNIPLSETERIAAAVTVAFRETRLTADELGAAINAAGSSALATGTSFESFVAITGRLKAINFDAGQIGAFEKKLFAALSAPTAKQLAALQQSGVSPYVAPEAFDPALAAGQSLSDAGAKLPGILGKAVGAAGAGLTGTAATAKAQQQAVQDAAAELVRLAGAQDKAEASLRAYDVLAKAAAADVKELQNAGAGFKTQLTDTTAALQDAKAGMAEVRAEIQALTNPRLTGMDAFDDEIAKLELAAKREELQLLRSAEAGAKFGDSLKESAGNAADLKTRLQELKSAELVGERAYNDRAFTIQQEIKQFELQKLKLAPHQLFEQNALSQQIARKQREFQIVNLEKDLSFDPARKSIDDALRGNAAAMRPEDVIAEAQRIGPRLGAAQDREQAGKARVDAARRAVQEKSLERDVTFGEDLNDIRIAQRNAARAAGIAPGEQDAADILASLPKLVGEYSSLRDQTADLTTKQEALEKVVRTYDKAIGDATKTMDHYQSRADLAKTSVDELAASTKLMEERFAGLPKIAKDALDLLTEIGNAGFTAGQAIEFMGARTGGMLTALLGPKGERVAELEKLRDLLKDLEAPKNAAKEVEGTSYGQAQLAKAVVENMQIDAGTVILSGAKGFVENVGNATDLRNYLPESWGGYQKKANGGLVPGYGYGDKVPAMLTPGEEVLRRDDPRHQMNGGGGTVINIMNPVVRSEADLDAIADRVSRAIAKEHRRAALGMPT